MQNSTENSKSSENSGSVLDEQPSKRPVGAIAGAIAGAIGGNIVWIYIVFIEGLFSEQMEVMLGGLIVLPFIFGLIGAAIGGVMQRLNTRKKNY